MKKSAVLAALILSVVAWAGPVLKEADFYTKLADKVVQCLICPRKCTIPVNNYGFCRARKNLDGTLYAMGYGTPCSVAVDPIEKKPFFHFLPSSTAFSIASAGCSLRCKFCQNWEISQYTPEQTRNYSLAPSQVVEQAAKYKCASIAYTYSEPMNFYEYMFDTAVLAKSKGIRNVVHTAGFVNPGPLERLCPYLDAVNVDLKGFSQDYYRDVCAGDLAAVLQALQIIKKNNVWLEITNLILPGYNDKPEDIRRMCLWIKNNLGADTPLHFSRFHPMFQMAHLPPTPAATVEKAVEIAREAGLKYVYIGNIPGHTCENTTCPKCQKVLIKRVGFSVLENNLLKGKCKFCGGEVAGIWN